jgi:hypothetical protein
MHAVIHPVRDRMSVKKSTLFVTHPDRDETLNVASLRDEYMDINFFSTDVKMPTEWKIDKN